MRVDVTPGFAEIKRTIRKLNNINKLDSLVELDKFLKIQK